MPPQHEKNTDFGEAIKAMKEAVELMRQEREYRLRETQQHRDHVDSELTTLKGLVRDMHAALMGDLKDKTDSGDIAPGIVAGLRQARHDIRGMKSNHVEWKLSDHPDTRSRVMSLQTHESKVLWIIAGLALSFLAGAALMGAFGPNAVKLFHP